MPEMTNQSVSITQENGPPLSCECWEFAGRCLRLRPELAVSDKVTLWKDMLHMSGFGVS